MGDKIPCKECGALILPTTAEKNGGLCMPCKNGYRKNIEQSKEYYKKERELDATCPYRALWRNLVKKVYDPLKGFETLSEDEKQYYAVGILDGEIYNGGFVQYFDNTSGGHYRYSELGLVRIGAKESLKLLREAKLAAFGKDPVPKEQTKRWPYTNDEISKKLDDLDTKYYETKEDVSELLEAFARETGLVKNV